MKEARAEPRGGSALASFMVRLNELRDLDSNAAAGGEDGVPGGFGDRDAVSQAIGFATLLGLARQQHLGETDGGRDLLDAAEVLVGGLLVVLARVEGCGVNGDNHGATPATVAIVVVAGGQGRAEQI